MRQIRLVIAVCALLAGGCAGFDPGPPPLTAAEVVNLSKAGEPPQAIVGRLKSSQTVLWLNDADLLALRQAGVAPEVLDYLQSAQRSETRRRAQFDQLLYGPEKTPFSRCGGFPPSGGRYNGIFAPFC